MLKSYIITLVFGCITFLVEEILIKPFIGVLSKKNIIKFWKWVEFINISLKIYFTFEIIKLNNYEIN